MNDQMIISLLYERSEKAIQELGNKYGKNCKAIAFRVLQNEQDAEECVNDACLAVWNTIPPQKPAILSAYIYKITRNLSVNRYHFNTAKKRNNHYDVIMEEVEEYLIGKENVEDEVLTKELSAHIQLFLKKLSKEDRMLFVQRYWFLKSVPELARDMGKTQNSVNVRLLRIREKLREYLRREGLYDT